jgi:molybdopterin converting factor small subunit
VNPKVIINVKLFATLRLNRFKVEEREFPAGASIQAVADALEIPREELALTLVNGMSVTTDYVLKDGDTLAIFPPVGGG